jgi:hypothetical protein
MRKMLTRIPRMIPLVLPAIALAVYICMSCDGLSAQEEVHDVENLIRKIVSGSKEEREEAEKNILDNRKKLVNALMTIIDKENAGEYSEEARASSAYLLGKLRAEEAAPTLARALENPPFDNPTGKGGMHYYTASVFTALLRIGRPSVPAVIEILRESTDRGAIRDSLLVLSHTLGGKAHMLELLDKLIAGEEGSEIKKKLEEVKETAEGYIKEKKVPLY